MRRIIAPRRDGGRPSQEVGAGLFQNLRVRLTLWYCAVLCAALVLFGVALYIGAQYFLISPLQNAAAGHAHGSQMQWLTQSADHACQIPDSHDQQGPPPSIFGFNMVEVVVCFDQNGSLLPGQDITGIPSALTSNTLVREALRTGQAMSDIVNAGGTMGQSYLYALPVPNQNGGGYQGVVMVGESIQVQENVLSLLLTLLLVVGGVALLCAGLGSLFLANHALAPARLAWTNQQRFIADASHELRTPLTLLRADAEVLLRGRAQLATEDAALLEDIVAEANHMSILATNMLTLARLDNSPSHQEHEVVNLIDVAHAGVRRIQALADQMEISVRVECTDTVLVIGDPALLEQAVLALLDNAIKYNHRGGHVIVRTAIQQGHALLEVSD